MKVLAQRQAQVNLELEDAAALQRLRSVSNRGRGEQALYPVPALEPEPRAARRLFWTPDEIADHPA